MTNLTRRQFLALAAATIASTACGRNQIAADKETPEETQVRPFAFLERTDNKELDALWKSKDIERLVDESILYGTYPQVRAPPKTVQVIKAQFPIAKVNSVTSYLYGYAEPNNEYALSYQEYARDLIAFAEQQLPNVQRISIDYLLPGQTRGSGVPLYIDWFRIENILTELTDPNHGSVTLRNYATKQGGIVINAFSVKRNDHGQVDFSPTNPTIALSTGNNNMPGVLGSPLSEYYGLALNPCVANHWKSFEKSYGGRIPRDQFIPIFDMTTVTMEAMSESVSRHILLDYVSREDVKPHLPSTIKDDIVKYVTQTMPSISWKYQYNEAAFNWMEKEGMEQAVDTYRNDIGRCVAKLAEYK